MVHILVRTSHPLLSFLAVPSTRGKYAQLLSTHSKSQLRDNDCQSKRPIYSQFPVLSDRVIAEMEGHGARSRWGRIGGKGFGNKEGSEKEGKLVKFLCYSD